MVGATALCLGLLVGGFRWAREGARQARCTNKLKTIWLALGIYQDTHGCLPPPYLTGENGNPTISWRVLAADSYEYNYEFQSKMEFSEPWDSPKNAPFLDALNSSWLRCPASRDAKAGVTHYVAVVGPGTLWPGSESAKLPRRPDAKGAAASHQPILVVEWPESDIHWAEPRDITVDEFLDRFRSRSRRSKTHHAGCILYIDAAGEVHELPNDSDPEAVRRLLMVEP